jgi:cysteine desulfurase
MGDEKKIVYLDYNATAPIKKEALDRMVEIYTNHPGNADSRTHEYGTAAKQIVSGCRTSLSAILGVSDTELIFTSGSTESNNMAILGMYDHAQKTGRKHFITTSIEHKSVLEAMRRLETLGCKVDYVAPDHTGRISAKALLSLVNENTLLVSVMHINSETGIIQPVEEIGEALSKTNVYFHVDATQSFGKLNDAIRKMKYDMLSFTAHKFGGPQGIGGLVLRRKRYKLPPITSLFCGGQQERSIRPGTTPVALIAGMTVAAEIADRECVEQQEKCAAIKKQLFHQLDGLRYTINGDPAFCIPNTINISFDGVDAESLFVALKAEYAFSNGSACNSSSYTPSYVLTEMGLSNKLISEAVRISWNADSEIDFTNLAKCINNMQ